VKKFLSIVLIAILALNVLGYYGVFLGLQYRNDLAITKSLDADVYDASKTITLRIPVSVAYMPDQSEFSRVDGKFEHHGQLYRTIKQRYAQDTLTIICVKDTEHEKIDTMLADYVTTFTDNASDHKSTLKVSLEFLKDYLSTSFSMQPASAGWTANVILNGNSEMLVSSFTASIIHPPQRA
jgi:hypothetical protein